MPDWKAEVRKRLLDLQLAPVRENAIVEELAQHLGESYAELLGCGVSEAEAQRQVLTELNENDLLTRELRRVERQVAPEPIILGTDRRTNMIADLWQDLRFGARVLVKQQGFTLIAVLTLALGIGANTAIFSLINSVLLKPLPYPVAERIVTIWETPPNGQRGTVSGGAFKDWRAHHSKFSHVALYKDVRLNVTGTETPEHVVGLQVSTEFLSVLGINPLLGRDFVAGEDARGGNNQVIMLAHQLWQRRYGADAAIIGRTISLNQTPYTVIGILPPGALLQEEHMFLLPFVFDMDTDTVKWRRDFGGCSALGRLGPGVTASEAQAELRDIKQKLAAEYPPLKKDWSVAVFPLQAELTGDVRPTLLILLGTVALVLLIACANVSNLLLARGAARAREMAIRTALGASSWRIIRQLLIESLLLALAGCGLGLLLAAFGIDALARMLTGQLPQLMHPELDLNVLTFSVLVACGCGVLFGLLPAMRASRPNLNHELKESERGVVSASRRRSQSVLVIAEFALTLVLLIGAGLFLRSFMRLLATDPGFNPQQTLAFDLSFAKTKYPQAAEQQGFLSDLSERIAALPGVTSVGAATSLPLSNRSRGSYLTRADKPEQGTYGVTDDFVSGDYFAALGIKLLRGRLITDVDNVPTATPVLVIDAKLARDLYPDEDPLGKTLTYRAKAWEVVGIVAPVRQVALHTDPPRKVYGPRAHFSYPTASMAVRSLLPPTSLVEIVRKTILEADPDQPIANVRTLEEAVHRSVARQRVTLTLLGLFAAVAILLACIGIYGVMSYNISQRTREFGIRVALGAQRGDILRLVFSGGMKLSVLGIAIGLVAAYFLSRLAEKLLFEVNTHDPLVFIASVSLLGIVAAISIYLPARRATQVDPMVALRAE